MTALVDTIRKQQQEIVLKWTQELCEALVKDFQRQSIERSTLSLLMCDKDEDHSIKYYQERIAEVTDETLSIVNEVKGSLETFIKLQTK